MSLINQALKKAQHDRSGRSEAQAQSDDSGSPAYAPPPVRPRSGLLLGLVGIGIILAIAAAAGFFFLASKDQVPAPEVAGEASQTEFAPEPLPAQAEPLPTAARALPSAPVEAVEPVAFLPQATLPQAPPAVPALDRTLAPEGGLDDARSTPILPEPQAEAAARAAAAISITTPASNDAAPDERIIQWLATAQVMGARISETGGRVLLNNEAYAVGEMVSYTLGLRVVAVEPGRILFEDERGVRYMKRY